MTKPSPFDPGYGPLVPTRVRIVTWNLWGRYGPWEERMPVIVENLGAINADILALQEVWEDDTRSQAERARGRARLHRAGVRGQPRTRRRALGQRGDLALADHAPRDARAAAPRCARRRRRGGRGAALPLRGDRRATRADPDVLRAPQLVGRPQRDPPGAGRRRSAASCGEHAAAAVPRGAVRRPQRRPRERRDPHVDRARRVAGATRGVPRRVGSGRQHRSRVHVVERQPVRRRPRST